MEYVRRMSVSCFQMRNPPAGNYPSDGQQAAPTLLVATLRVDVALWKRPVIIV